MIWLVSASLALATLTLLVLPLLRRQSLAPSRVEYDIVVYRDQLAEVAKDRDRGLLNDDQAEGIRTEILRRMLAAEDAEEDMIAPRDDRLGPKARLVLTLAILLVVPTAALLFYLQLGAPNLPSQPIVERRMDPSFALASQAEEMAARLENAPTPEGYKLLAGTYSSLRRYNDAAEAYRSAIQIGQTDAETWSALGEALVLANDGTVVAEAFQAFSHALSVDLNDSRARFYQGLAKMQGGDLRSAVAIWRDLEKDGPADAAWMPMVKEHIATYARQGGFDPTDVSPVHPQPDNAVPPVARTQPDAESGPMAGKSPEEQQQFIRSMVANLAARMETTPDDLDGWLRLGRAYRVLGQTDKAKQALRRAVALRPTDISLKLGLAEVQLDEIKDGPFPADFVENMRSVLTLDPDNPDALYYVGEAEHQAGKIDKARSLWRKALQMLPPDSKEREGIQKNLDALGK